MMALVGHKRLYLTIGLTVLVLSLLVWIPNSSRDAEPPIITKKEAVQVALNYLAENDITVEIVSTQVLFSKGNWLVMFFIDPFSRPADVWMRIHPISGEASIVPLK